MSLSVGTFYELFVQEMRNDMKAYTHVLRSAGVFNASNEEKLNLKNEDLRITIIDADGTVVYDNEANDIEMDNHKDRPEIESALKNGEGSDVRKSSTLNKSTYYYAVLLDDGQVLRIAKEASSVWNIFIKVLPLILGIIILMLFSVGIITHYITKSIVKPVEELANNIDEIKDIKTYKEIQPFIDTIKKQHEDIVKNSHVRQEFTANVSHELKTPLTSIIGYSDMLRSMELSGDDIRMCGEYIFNQGSRLEKLSYKLLELVGIDKHKIIFKQIQVKPLVQNVEKIMQKQLEGNNLLFETNIDSGFIAGDEDLIISLLCNIIDNGRKACRGLEGKIILSGVCCNDEYIFSVEDNGCGMPADELEKIKEAFYMVDKSRARKEGGAGIGMALCDKIVGLHNANWTIESEPQKGTKVTISFPVNLEAEYEKI